MPQFFKTKVSKSVGLTTSAQDLFSQRLSPKEAAAIEACFARLFSSEDGKQVLGYLHAMVFDRTLGPDASDSTLRYQEGQRAFLALILRLIDRGKRP